MVGYFLSELKLYRKYKSLWIPILLIIGYLLYKSFDIYKLKDLLEYAGVGFSLCSLCLAYFADKRFALFKETQFDSVLQALPNRAIYMRSVLWFQVIIYFMYSVVYFVVLSITGFYNSISWELVILYIVSFSLASLVQFIIFWLVLLRFQSSYSSVILVGIFILLSIFVNKTFSARISVYFDIGILTWLLAMKAVLLEAITIEKATRVIIFSLIPKIIVSIGGLWLLFRTTEKNNLFVAVFDSVWRLKWKNTLDTISYRIFRWFYPVRVYAVWMYVIPWVFFVFIALFFIVSNNEQSEIFQQLSSILLFQTFYFSIFLYVNLGNETRYQCSPFIAGTPYSLVAYRVRQLILFMTMPLNIMIANIGAYSILFLFGTFDTEFFINQSINLITKDAIMHILLISTGFALYLLTSIRFMVFMNVPLLAFLSDYSEASPLRQLDNIPSINYVLALNQCDTPIGFVFTLFLYWVMVAIFIVASSFILSDFSARRDIGRPMFSRERKLMIVPMLICSALISAFFFVYYTRVTSKMNEGFIIRDAEKNRESTYNSLFESYKDVPSPSVSKIIGELYLQNNAVKGIFEYTITNTTDKPISSFILSVYLPALSGYYKFDADMKEYGTVIDKRYGEIITLAKPLQVGESLSFSCKIEHQEQWWNKKIYFFDSLQAWNYALMPQIGFLYTKEQVAETEPSDYFVQPELSNLINSCTLDIVVHSQHANFHPLAQQVKRIDETSWRIQSKRAILSHSENFIPTFLLLSGKFCQQQKFLTHNMIHILSLKKRNVKDIDKLFSYVEDILRFYASLGIVISQENIYIIDSPSLGLRYGGGTAGLAYISMLEFDDKVLEHTIASDKSKEKIEAISTIAHELSHLFVPYAVPTVSSYDESLYSEGIPELMACLYIHKVDTKKKTIKLSESVKFLQEYESSFRLGEFMPDSYLTYSLAFVAQHAISTIMGQENYFAALKKAYTENIPISKYTFTRYLPDKTANIETVIKQWKSLKFHRDIALSSANAVKSAENTSWELSIEAEDSLAEENLPLYCSVEGEGKEANIAATSVVTRKKKGYRITCIVPFKPSHVRINPYVLPEKTYENNEGSVVHFY